MLVLADLLGGLAVLGIIEYRRAAELVGTDKDAEADR